IDAAIERAIACVEAGADALFPEAITDLAQCRRFADAVHVPILANITEFGATPLYNKADLAAAGVAMVLYPLSAFRAMSKAASTVYESILREGDQGSVVKLMQTRAELYEVLGYHAYEEKLDQLFSSNRTEN
ncbi:MAG: isocitrate lyase/phosphoenolpyruvate mutase family protein, partial [Pseudomonadales bacterium]|nr:isocitrate lyase/phosphoenolpyruvate mutase family protein [Pseudomonadales bacterium]